MSTTDREVPIEAYDFFFGTIWIRREPPSASCNLGDTIARSLGITAGHFTAHMLRMVKRYERFRLTAGNSDFDVTPLFDLIDSEQVTTVRLYRWLSGGPYTFIGAELIFRTGPVDVESCWTFDGSHEGELRSCLLEPLQKSSLAQMVKVRDGDKVIAFSEQNLAHAYPLPSRIR